ncbi:MAG: hypothetical protein IPM42_19815 [Saprospiraceae bacterium]|nr:hypothetical protein [Saprospiraceae bacterium]
MSTIYSALTIGPIYKTFVEAKRTRAVWASSYFFSWFIRRVLEDAVNQNMQVFLPDTSLMKKQDNKHIGIKGQFGAGLYADRLYFINNENTNKEKLNEIVEKIILEVESLSAGTISYEFLSSYLNIHIIEKTISNNASKNEDYPLAILNRTLDNKELHQNYNFNFENNLLQNFLSNKTNARDSFLAQDAFGDNNERRFKSITEISTNSFSRIQSLKTTYTKEINKDLKSKEDTDLIEELIKAKLPLLPHHKYLAVIYADGDSIGTLLKEANEKNLEIKEFSKALFEFGIKAEQTIAHYGGSGIYLGGEDILIFAPVACIDKENENVQKTIFDLIMKLDINFSDTVQQYAKNNKVTIPTMSYGVMIAYYKYPLKEILTEAHNQLEKAKDKDRNKDKNAIAIRFQKHSGQFIEGLIKKSHNSSSKKTYELVEKYCSKPKNVNDKTDELLSSIIQKFRDDVFVELYSKAVEMKTLDAFFANFFNEKIHTDSDKAKFLLEVKDLSESIFSEYNDKGLAKKNLYLVLRFIHFVNSQKEN